MEEAGGQTAAVESRELLGVEVQQDRRGQSPVRQQLLGPPELRRELQRNRPALRLRDQRDGRVRDQVNNRHLLIPDIAISLFVKHKHNIIKMFNTFGTNMYN